MNKPEPMHSSYNIVGTRPVRPDGIEKVTGRAQYGADLSLPQMVWGAVLRSPHAHARILSIDCSDALTMPGVLATATSDDFAPPGQNAEIRAGELVLHFNDAISNCLARGKVLFEGHPIAAVAATTLQLAEEAANRIKVEYEVLEPVLDIDRAQAPDAPLLHEDMYTQGYDTKPEKPSNVAVRCFFERGDLEAGFKQADLIVERTYIAPRSHQGYIEPPACVVESTREGKLHIWCCTQGQFSVQTITADILGMDVADIRVTPSEIGGGFGGKLVLYLEPIAAALSLKCHRPVKMKMSRADVLRTTGPTSESRVRVKIGTRRDGTFTAMDAKLEFDAGAFAGSPVGAGALTAFAAYDVVCQRVEGLDIVMNKCKTSSYRAPGAPNSALAVECVVNEIAEKLGIDPIELREKNAAKDGTATLYGGVFNNIGLLECLRQAKQHPHYTAPLGQNEGRGLAVGFWFNMGLSSSASVHLTESGRIQVQEGNPDIGGTRAAMAQMAAETLGIPYDHVGVQIMDTASIGYTDATGASRTCYATGYAVTEATRDLIKKLRERAALIWETDLSEVDWQDGQAIYIEDTTRRLTLAEIGGQMNRTGGPLSGTCSIALKTAGPGFSVNIADVRVDKETGRTQVTRYTAIQDAGKAVHPSFVEGQMQGAAAQGIGWALNECYYYDDKGVLQNQGFLDYRMPVALDLPMIDTVIVEVPNPEHPYGVRGVGEVGICPPLGAVCTAVNNALGTRITELPLSPPRVLAAILAHDG